MILGITQERIKGVESTYRFPRSAYRNRIQLVIRARPSNRLIRLRVQLVERARILWPRAACLRRDDTRPTAPEYRAILRYITIFNANDARFVHYLRRTRPMANIPGIFGPRSLISKNASRRSYFPETKILQRCYLPDA